MVKRKQEVIGENNYIVCEDHKNRIKRHVSICYKCDKKDICKIVENVYKQCGF
jgi:hypothetical protein